MTHQSVTQLDRKLRTLIQRLKAENRGTDRHDQLSEELKELKDARRRKLAPKTFDRMLSSLG